MLVLTKRSITLGAYEKLVILELDNELTLEQAHVLVLTNQRAIELLCMIQESYSRGLTTVECVAAILEHRKTIVIPGCVPVRCNSNQ